MPFAERYAFPTHAEIGTSIPRTNDFKELFYVRWGRIHFAAFWGDDLNLKVVLNVYRSEDVCERFIIDTDWNYGKRITRDFYIHPFSAKLGHARRITFSFIVHTQNRSIPSEREYRFIEGSDLQTYDQHHHWCIGMEGSSLNHYRTRELDAAELQRDVDWCNHHLDSLASGADQPAAPSADPSADEIERIVQSRHDMPHRVLGPQPARGGQGTTVRAFMPHARRVVLRLFGEPSAEYDMHRAHRGPRARRARGGGPLA